MRTRAGKDRILVLAVTLLLAITVAAGCGTKMVTVPKLDGLGEAQARSALQKAGLIFKAKTEEASDTIPAGTVIRAEPGSGAKVKKGTGVALVVSTGPKPIAIPDVLGSAEADATAELGSLGMQVNVQRVFSDSAGSGIVIGMDPAAGTLCLKGSVVNITVSKGSAVSKGSGTSKGSVYVSCSACGGDGQVETSTTCSECGGTGVCYS